ncbi:MAG: S8 family serine peptidase [Candidatus Omnitrophota bacterium]
MQRISPWLAFAAVLLSFVFNHSHLDAKTEAEVVAPITTVTSEDINNLPSSRDLLDLTAILSNNNNRESTPRPQMSNYPNLRGFSGPSVLGCPHQSQSRIKDSVNWSGFGSGLGPNFHYQPPAASNQGQDLNTIDRELIERVGINLSPDFKKYSGGGMTQIDPPAQTQTPGLSGDDDYEIKYTEEELAEMAEIPTAEDIRRINTDPFGEMEQRKAERASSQEQVQQPVASGPIAPQGLTQEDAEKLSAAFLVTDDANVNQEYQNNLRNIQQQHVAQAEEEKHKLAQYHEQEQRALQMEQDRLDRLAALDHAQENREIQQASQRDSMREEVVRRTQEILNTTEDYINNAGSYDPYILKWVSIAAEMQHQTKKLADSCLRDQMRAQAKLKALEEWEQAHAQEVAENPHLKKALLNMKFAAQMLYWDAELVWLSTKELVLYGAMIDVGTFVFTSIGKALGVAKTAAQEAAMRVTLNAARKPTAYVVGDVMVNAAGKGADEAAARFMGTAGQQGVRQVAGGAAGQAAGTGAAGQAAGELGDSTIGQGIRDMLSGRTLMEKEVKMNLITEGVQAEMNRMAQVAVETGIPKEEVAAAVAAGDIDGLAIKIIEKLGGKIVSFKDARPIFEISTRALAGTATSADKAVLEALIRQSEAQGVNFWDDLARQGIFGNDGFQPIATMDVIAALKRLVTTGVEEALDKTARLSPEQIQNALQTSLQGALDKTAQIAVDKADDVATQILDNAFDKTVQLTPQQLDQMMATVIDGVLDKTVRLSPEYAEQFAKTVVDKFLEKTQMMSQQEAMRFAETVAENILEHTAQMTEREAAQFFETVVEKIMDKTVLLTEKEVSAFINNVTEEVFAKTLHWSKEETVRLSQSIIDRFLSSAAQRAEANSLRMAETMIDDALKTTTKLDANQALRLAETVIDDVAGKTTIMTPGGSLALAQTVIDGILAKTTQLSQTEAAALAQTVIENIMEKTVKMSPIEAAALAETVIGDVLARTVQLSERQIAELAQTVVDQALAKTLKLSGQEASQFAKTVGENVLDRTVIDDLVGVGSQEALEKMPWRQFINHIYALSEKEQLEGLVQYAKKIGLTDEAINVAKSAKEPVLNLLRSIIEKEGNIIIAGAEANKILALSTRVLRNTATDADMRFLQEMVQKYQAQGLDYFAQLAKQGTLSVAEGFQNVAQKDVIEALRNFAQSQTRQALADTVKIPSTAAATSAANSALDATSLNLGLEGLSRTGLNYRLDFNIPKQTGDLWQAAPRLDFSQFSYGSFLSDEKIGAAAGLSGPIITSGLLNKEPIVSVFDAAGIPVGSVTAKDVKSNPALTRDLIDFAQNRSLAGQRDYFRDWSGGLGYNFGPKDVTAIDLRGSNADFMRSNLGRIPGGIDYASTLVPQLGMGQDDLGILSDGINHQLVNRASPENFFDPFHCCGVVYLDEPVFLREVLAPKKETPAEAIVPNDPLYLDLVHQKKMGGKSGKPVVVMGSGMKMQGEILGVVLGGSDKNEEKIKDQWGIREVGFTPKTNADSAWNLVDAQKKNVLIAVIDSGLDLEHPDGPQYIWTNPKEIPDNNIDDDQNGYVDDVHGWNFLDNNNDLRDFKGHGTNVSGIIAAKADNGIGIAGINPGAQIMVLKVVNPDGRANSINIYRAFRYAADHGARIINISLGDVGVSKLEQLAVNYAYAKGVFIVAASGNDNEFIGLYGPASAKHVFSVGSQDFEGTRSTVSNWGPNLGLIAPGEQIYTLHSQDAKWEGNPKAKEKYYFRVSGTSFSAPIVAATASLLLAKDPNLTHDQLRGILINSAKDMKDSGWDGLTGGGSLDAVAALEANIQDVFVVQLTELRINPEDNKEVSLDVFGTVYGDVSDFIVELGRGRNPSGWTKIAGPFTQPANANWLCRVKKELLRGSKDWNVRITATDKKGQTKTAQSLVVVK